MKLPIELLLAAAERSGGAVAPPDVLALCGALRKYTAIIADLAGFVDNIARVAESKGQRHTQEFLDFVLDMAKRVEDARMADVPQPT